MHELNTPGISSDPWPPARLTPLLPHRLRCLGHLLRPTNHLHTHRPSCSHAENSRHEGGTQQHTVRARTGPWRKGRTDEVEDGEEDNSRREVASCVENVDIGKTTAKQGGHRRERMTGWSRHD
ncbi:hypothetical protein NQZ68_040377 [Dissostichus eleginoides]|nr:hypothetical protein NQZ68_040377 [Dissostichus eleginoides]